MGCVACFQSYKFQNELKRKSFSCHDFLSELEQYKQNYMNEVLALVPVNLCGCMAGTLDSGFIDWTNSFMSDMKIDLQLIEGVFDQLMSVFKTERIDANAAKDDFKAIIKQYEVDLLVAPQVMCNSIWYRGRPLGSYNPQDIKELFHIPFSKRGFASCLRFNKQNEPTLYFGSSILAVEKELSTTLVDLNIGAFAPIYSIYYNKKIFDFRNILFETIQKSLPAIFSDGMKISYSDKHMSINSQSIKTDLARSIIYEVCTFPVDPNGNGAKEEYTLPNILSDILRDLKFIGIQFPSTKSYIDLVDEHEFSRHNINVVIFVEDNKMSDIDIDRLNSFRTYAVNGSETYSYTLKDIEDMMDVLRTKFIASSKGRALNDEKIQTANIKLHLEYMKHSKINGVDYYDSITGKTELEFISKLLIDFDAVV